MICTTRIEICIAVRANISAIHIFRDRQLLSANSAKNRFCFKLIRFPNFRPVRRAFPMTFKTRKPVAAAFELNRNYIKFAVPMFASRLFINFDAVNFFAVNNIYQNLNKLFSYFRINFF